MKQFKIQDLTPLFFLAFTAFIFSTGCGFGDSGLNELKRLCEKDAGLIIYKTVEAEGYYDSTRKGETLWVLVASDYNFMEFCNLDPEKPSFDEPGCWRLTKVSRETGQCNERVDKSLRRNGSDSSREFREQNCIAVEKIEKPEAQYSYHSVPKQWLDKNGKSEFRRSDAYIEDVATSEILGRFVSYSYNEKPRHTSPTSCNRFGDKFPSYAEANLINTVLIPISKGVSHD